MYTSLAKSAQKFSIGLASGKFAGFNTLGTTFCFLEILKPLLHSERLLSQAKRPNLSFLHNIYQPKATAFLLIYLNRPIYLLLACYVESQEGLFQLDWCNKITKVLLRIYQPICILLPHTTLWSTKFASSSSLRTTRFFIKMWGYSFDGLRGEKRNERESAFMIVYREIIFSQTVTGIDYQTPSLKWTHLPMIHQTRKRWSTSSKTKLTNFSNSKHISPKISTIAGLFLLVVRLASERLL